MYGLSGREELESGVIIVWGATGFASGSGFAAEEEKLPPVRPSYRIEVYRNRDDEQADKLLKDIWFNTLMPEVVDRKVREAIDGAQSS